MIAYLLAAFGGYLIGQSQKVDLMENGGMMDEGGMMDDDSRKWEEYKPKWTKVKSRMEKEKADAESRRWEEYKPKWTKVKSRMEKEKSKAKS